jgi:ribosome-associated toxin RatA of RatAB toxin-antitoxin module
MSWDRTTVEEFTVKAPPEIVFDVITDFNSYSTFLSSVKVCRRVRDRIQYQVKPFAASPVVHYTLLCQESRPRLMKWSLADKTKHFLENSGSWELIPCGLSETNVKYTSRIHLKPPIPSWVAQNLQEQSMPTLHREFREEAERRFKIEQLKK